MLLFGLNDLFTTRAQFVSSHPEPGESVLSPPTEVTVIFSEELAPESSIRLVCTVTLNPSGEPSYSGGQAVTATSVIEAYDLQHGSMKAVPLSELPSGLYRVDWTAVALKNKAQRFGSYYFASGMAVPGHILREGKNSLREENFSYSDERNLPQTAVFAGLILVLLGVFWNHLPKRSHRQ